MRLKDLFTRKPKDKTVYKMLGVVFDVMPGGWIELEFRDPDGLLIHHYIQLDEDHNLKIGEFITVKYVRSR